MGISFKLSGESIKNSERLSFKAKDKEGKDFNLEDVKGKKVISLFPALNTKVCDAQTLKIVQWSREHKDISFISVTNDPVEVIKDWCAAHNIDNVFIVSDKEYKEFARATNLYVKKINKLARGFIILDENNIIIDQSFKADLSEEPGFEMVEKYL